MRAKVLRNYRTHKVGDIVEVEPSDKEDMKRGCTPGYYVTGKPHNFYDADFFFQYELELLPDDPAPTQLTAPGGPVVTPAVMVTPIKFGHPEFYKLLEEMAALHSRKNHDYAGTKDPLRNLKSSVRLGLDPVTGVLVRLQDKMSRLESFAQQGELLVKDESVEDTLMDIAVYSLLGIILRREGKVNASK